MSEGHTLKPQNREIMKFFSRKYSNVVYEYLYTCFWIHAEESKMTPKDFTEGLADVFFASSSDIKESFCEGTTIENQVEEESDIEINYRQRTGRILEELNMIGLVKYEGLYIHSTPALMNLFSWNEREDKGNIVSAINEIRVIPDKIRDLIDDIEGNVEKRIARLKEEIEEKMKELEMLTVQIDESVPISKEVIAITLNNILQDAKSQERALLTIHDVLKSGYDALQNSLPYNTPIEEVWYKIQGFFTDINKTVEGNVFKQIQRNYNYHYTRTEKLVNDLLNIVIEESPENIRLCDDIQEEIKRIDTFFRRANDIVVNAESVEMNKRLSTRKIFSSAHDQLDSLRNLLQKVIDKQGSEAIALPLIDFKVESLFSESTICVRNKKEPENIVMSPPSNRLKYKPASSKKIAIKQLKSILSEKSPLYISEIVECYEFDEKQRYSEVLEIYKTIRDNPDMFRAETKNKYFNFSWEVNNINEAQFLNILVHLEK